MKKRTTTARPKKRRKRTSRPKVCRLCEDKVAYLGFQEVDVLSRYVTDKGRILPRRITGCCAIHQKLLTRAIQRARNLALMS